MDRLEGQGQVEPRSNLVWRSRFARFDSIGQFMTQEHLVSRIIVIFSSRRRRVGSIYSAPAVTFRARATISNLKASPSLSRGFKRRRAPPKQLVPVN